MRRDYTQSGRLAVLPRSRWSGVARLCTFLTWFGVGVALVATWAALWAMGAFL